jgi:hypothetical protein
VTPAGEISYYFRFPFETEFNKHSEAAGDKYCLGGN